MVDTARKTAKRRAQEALDAACAHGIASCAAPRPRAFAAAPPPALRARAFRERASRVLDPAALREARAAALRRLARGMDDGVALLPGDAARGLPVRAPARAPAAAARSSCCTSVLVACGARPRFRSTSRRSTRAPTRAVLSLLAVLALSLGFPFFALTATAPLLQQWFSRSGHRHAADPYFLYSASNAGSLLALIGYPLAARAAARAAPADARLVGGVRACSRRCSFSRARCWRSGAAAPATAPAPCTFAAPAAPLSRRAPRLRWFLLAFAPSSLMLGVTQHITSEIAAAPLLWLDSAHDLRAHVRARVRAHGSACRLRAIDRVQPLARHPARARVAAQQRDRACWRCTCWSSP